MESPPSYPRTPHWPWSETVHRDDTYHADPQYFVGREVVITEKLDGGNTTLWGGEAYARSTGQPAHHGWFAMVRKHHAWKTTNFDPTDVFYGEDLYGIHSIEYEPMREDETFRLFAVRRINDEDIFTSWAEVETAAERLGVKTVPICFRGRFDSVEAITEWFRQHLRLPSALGGQREGFVLRLAEAFPAERFALSISKFVRPHHVATNRHWTKNWRPCRLIR